MLKKKYNLKHLRINEIIYGKVFKRNRNFIVFLNQKVYAPCCYKPATVTNCSHSQLSIITASTEYDLEHEQQKTH